MFNDKTLQFQDLSFDPPLYSKKAKNFRVIVIDEHGNQLIGITVRLTKKGSAEINIPDVLKHHDSTRTTLQLSQLTKDTLRERIRERIRNRFA
jgi:hypothetical protein